MNSQFFCRALLRNTPVASCVRRARILFSSFLLCVSAAASAQNTNIDPGLIAHEWGTFTSIAGESGQGVEWLPLNGPSDLPGFVEHFRGAGFKVGLGGTIRMETPVLYFYSTHDATVDVSVSFLHGLITEWYPQATHIEPSSSLNNVALFQQQSLEASRGNQSACNLPRPTPRSPKKLSQATTTPLATPSHLHCNFLLRAAMRVKNFSSIAAFQSLPRRSQLWFCPTARLQQ